MKKNMGTLDRVLRTIAAVAIGVLFFTDRISGTLAIILGVVAVAFLVSSFVSVCPAYMPLGISTCKAPEASDDA